jgi:hypothetical protein
MAFPQWVAFALAAFCEAPRVPEAALVDCFTAAVAAEAALVGRCRLNL